MKLQVFLISCFLFAGNSANPSRHENGDSDDLRQLLAEFSEATVKWSSLYDKFDKVKSSDCREPENSPVCKAIEEEARTVTDKLGGHREEQMRTINGILSSLQEKMEKLERKMETGVGGTISTRDYIQAMRALERRLHYFQAAIASLGKEVKSPMRYVDGTDDDAVEEVRRERASGRVYDEEEREVKSGGKSGKTVAVPYKKLLSAIDRLEEVVKNVKNCGAKNQVQDSAVQYKNTIFKDMKDMLEDISEDIKSLRKFSAREMNENEKILRKINKKLERELKDDDKDDEDLKRSLKKYMVEQRKELEKAIKKAVSKRGDDTEDDTDDSDEKGKREESEEDESCDDSDGCDRKKRGRDSEDSDENDDDDETDDDKGRKKGKDETDDSDDTDDTDDTDEDDRKGRKKKNRENLTKKHSAPDEEDVEFLRNSASGGPFGKNKFVTSLIGIPPYIDH